MAAARRVALKMGRRLRCSSGAYRFRYAPLAPVRLGPPCQRPILNATISQLYMGRCTRSVMVISGAMAISRNRVREMRRVKRGASPEGSKTKRGGSIRNLEVGLDLDVYHPSSPFFLSPILFLYSY